MDTLAVKLLTVGIVELGVLFGLVYLAFVDETIGLVSLILAVLALSALSLPLYVVILRE